MRHLRGDEQKLGSVLSLPLPGDYTSNFAVDQEVVGEGKLDPAHFYVQIDLRLCEDVESWKSVSSSDPMENWGLYRSCPI